MTPNCHRHTWEIAEATCRECKLGYCETCLVYPGDTASPPTCVPCALAVAGVRRTSRPRISWRQRRSLAKAAAREPVVPPAEVAPEPAPAWAAMDPSRWEISAS